MKILVVWVAINLTHGVTGVYTSAESCAKYVERSNTTFNAASPKDSLWAWCEMHDLRD